MFFATSIFSRHTSYWVKCIISFRNIDVLCYIRFAQVVYANCVYLAVSGVLCLVNSGNHF